MSTDKRGDDRQAVNLEFASVDQFLSEYVTNLSRTGAFIRSDDPLPVGTRVALKFTIIARDLETVEGVGEVVRTVAKGGSEPSGMGVVFISLTSVSRQLIDRLLTRQP